MNNTTKLVLLFTLSPLFLTAQLFRTKTTHGSIDSAKNILRLSRGMNAKAGDRIIVFIGGEVHGGGRRGYRGVGGQTPQLVYNSNNEMLRDKSQPPGTWASVIGTKGIKRYNNEWWDASYGALDASIPRPLVATVTKISNGGLQLQLDKAAQCKVVNARIAFDETENIRQYVIKNKVFNAKALGFKKGDTLWFGDRLKWEYIPGNEIIGWDGWRPENLQILGNGMTFSSVPGGIPMCVGAEEGNKSGFVVRDLDIVQHGTYEGLGIDYTPGHGVPLRNEAFENPWLHSPGFGGWMKGAVAINVRIFNPAAYAFYGGSVKNCGVKIFSNGIKQYNGWPYVFCDIENSWLESPHLIRAVEIEATTGTKVKGFRSVNGLFASNSSWNATFKDIDITLTKGAAKDNPAMLANPVFEIHGHIKGHAGNITVEDLTLRYEGYLDDEGGLLRDFFIKDGVDGVQLKNIRITKPPVMQPYGRGNGYGATLISGATGLSIQNFTTNAKMGKAFEKFTKDNAPFDIRGKGTVLRNVNAEGAVVPRDAVVEACRFERGIDYLE